MNLLNQDNIVHEFLNNVGDIVIANILFIFCSIPLVTIGPSRNCSPSQTLTNSDRGLSGTDRW